MSPKNVALDTKNLVDMGVLTRNGRAEHVITPMQSVCLSNGRYSPVLPFEHVDKLGLFVVVQDLASIGHNTEQWRLNESGQYIRGGHREPAQFGPVVVKERFFT